MINLTLSKMKSTKHVEGSGSTNASPQKPLDREDSDLKDRSPSDEM